MAVGIAVQPVPELVFQSRDSGLTLPRSRVPGSANPFVNYGRSRRNRPTGCNYVIADSQLYYALPGVFNFRVPAGSQMATTSFKQSRRSWLCIGTRKSRAIAKMTARCALYMDALKNFGSPWLRPRLLFPKLLMDFCCNRSYESAYKIWSS